MMFKSLSAVVQTFFKFILTDQFLFQSYSESNNLQCHHCC